MDPIEHLTSLIINIPSWLLILDEQKEQLGRRQAELARLSGEVSSSDHSHGTSSRSLKNKGSAESLRPKANQRLDEENEEAIASDANEDTATVEELKKENILSSKKVRSKSQNTPRSPQALQRQPSNSNKISPASPFNASSSALPTTHTPQGRLLKRRKSKASSLHSMHSSKSRTSQASGHPARFNRSNRTRSMIIVYYDSFVQEAFENLVRHISTARNNIRKGKMAERMGRMRMLAELEESSSDEEETFKVETSTTNGRKAPQGYPTLKPNPNIASSTGRDGAAEQEQKPGLSVLEKSQNIEADDGSEDDDEEFMEKARLQFKSTRMMGSNRAVTDGGAVRLSSMNASAAGFQRASTGPAANSLSIARPPITQASSSPALNTNLGANLRNTGEDKSIYDELDKSLEWCQATCERAAHRFLRDGECYPEIAGIRRRLEDLSTQAQTEIQKVEKEKKEEKVKKGERGSGSQVQMRGSGLGGIDTGSIRARQMRSPLMRKPSTPTRTRSDTSAHSSLNRDTVHEDEGLGADIEVDDAEGSIHTGDDQTNPTIVFRSSRAGGVVRR